MQPASEVVVTGVGVVSPIGIGKAPFWESLRTGKSGVRRNDTFVGYGLPFHMTADIPDFDPKQYVKPRKSLKVMCRPIQTAFAAAGLALEDAAFASDAVDPDRFGVVLGSEMLYGDLAELEDVYRNCHVDGVFDSELWGRRFPSDLFPLWMLKYLPNMAACHIGIAHDARGHNNSITLGEVSSLLAVGECVSIIQRGLADVMIAGGSGERMDLTSQLYRGGIGVSRRNDAPQQASRPFDADRDGMVIGEGAGAFILESEPFARRRGAPILARVLGTASAFEPEPADGRTRTGSAVRRSIELAMQAGGLNADQVGHVNAHGLSTIEQDRIEAQGIHAAIGSAPVTAPKSFFGNLGAGGGAVEMAASVMALATGEIPPTLNYETPDPDCPLNIVAGGPQTATHPTALILSQSTTGQAAAIALAAP